MIQLLWGILNIVTFIGFIIFCFKKTIEIRNKMGALVAIVFAFFALSFIGKSNKETVVDKKFEFQNKEAKLGTVRDSFLSEINLEDDISTNINLTVNCVNNNVTSALTTRTGLISGTEWKTDYIIINKTGKKNTFQYQVLGTRKWKILGIEVASESKEFKGTKEFKPYSFVP